MVEISMHGDRARFVVEGWDKFWALRSQLEIPPAHIRGVRVDPESARGWWHGLKLAGTGIPGVVRNLFIVAVVGPAIFLTAQFGLWSGAIGPFRVSSMGLWPGLVCGVMACWMLYDSKVGKLRERERLLDLMPWRGTEAVLDLGCGRGPREVRPDRRDSGRLQARADRPVPHDVRVPQAGRRDRPRGPNGSRPLIVGRSDPAGAVPA